MKDQCPQHSEFIIETHHTLAVFHIDLVSKHNEGEVVGIFRRRVYQELVSPRIDCIEGFGIIDVVHQNAAIGAPIESNPETLESFLTRRVP